MTAAPRVAQQSIFLVGTLLHSPATEAPIMQAIMKVAKIMPKGGTSATSPS